ncbi:hypothetical protein J3E72DRAFT_198675 [Bipolaris maydis]|nr:hypothetical protein J3E72DRAFT_377112 [Bipolaris maydis]KAJ6194651.1 hypothetical protein J3E72DRAFT_198675 [Bipolaris maydis]
MSATLTGIARRVYAVTGGASGMGAAAVRELARQNASAIWIADWNDKAFNHFTAEIKNINNSTKVYTTKVDVSDSKAVDAWIEKVVEVSGGLHGAINLAGLPQSAPRTEEFTSGKVPAIVCEPDHEIDKITAVNWKGVVYSTRAEVRAMLKMPKGSNPAIVNIASLASINHVPVMFTYGATKAAVAHFSGQVAADVARFGIRCNAVSPALINTPMVDTFLGGMQNAESMKETSKGLELIEPEHMAKVMVWLLSDTASHVNGLNMLLGATPS